MNNYKIYQYDLNGKFIREFESISQAAHVNKINHSVINKGLSHKYGYANCYLWSDKPKLKLKPYKPKHINQIKKVYQYDLNGNYITTFKSCSEAERQLNISKGLISDALKRKGYSSGFMWSYKLTDNILPHKFHNAKIIGMYDKKTKLLIKSFFSISDASRILNIPKQTLQRSVNYNSIIRKLRNVYFVKL